MSITGCRPTHQHNWQRCGEWPFAGQPSAKSGSAKTDFDLLAASELVAQPLNIKWQITENFSALTHRLDQPVIEHQFDPASIASAEI